MELGILYSLQEHTGDGVDGTGGSCTVFRSTLVMELGYGVLYSLQDYTGDGAGIWVLYSLQDYTGDGAGIWGPIQSSRSHR